MEEPDTTKASTTHTDHTYLKGGHGNDTDARIHNDLRPKELVPEEWTHHCWATAA